MIRPVYAGSSRGILSLKGVYRAGRHGMRQQPKTAGSRAHTAQADTG